MLEVAESRAHRRVERLGSVLRPESPPVSRPATTLYWLVGRPGRSDIGVQRGGDIAGGEAVVVGQSGFGEAVAGLPVDLALRRCLLGLRLQ